jgi:folate-binding protein YgfZ
MFSQVQYRALHEAAGLLDRTSRGRLLLTGEDRRTYLHGLLTNDILALSEGTGCYAALLTPQGRMVADMRVMELGDAVLIDLDESVTSLVRDRLEQFVFSEDVQVADATASRAQIGVYGPSAAVTVTRAIRSGRAEAADQPAEHLDAMTLYHNSRWDFNGEPVIIVRSDDIGIAGFDLFVDRAHGQQLIVALRAAGAVDIDIETADVCRVEAGRPAFGVDMDEHTIPLEAGIEDRAISLTKGCYVGQEIIIRVLHRGHGRVARRLVGLALDPEALVPKRGDRIREAGRDVGHVTSAAASPAAGRPVALGYVHRDSAEPSTQLSIVSNGRESNAVVVTLPVMNARERSQN